MFFYDRQKDWRKENLFRKKCCTWLKKIENNRFFISSLLVYLQDSVTIQYVKLHADPKEGKTLDISKFFKYVWKQSFVVVL